MTSRQAFGLELRQQRERRGVSLETIANATKIGKSLLAGLERGDCSRWPGGIYSRAYVKDYARAIGLDPDEVAASFLACFEPPKPQPAAGRDQAPRVATGDTPLRMTLAEDEGNLSSALLRIRSLAIDALIVLASAAALSAATDIDIWMAGAGASLACHAIGILRGGTPTGSILAAWLRGPVTQGPVNDRHTESVAARTA